MPAFNFMKQFADDVESGEKRQTIRSKRKNRPQVGQTAFLYTGMRHSSCRKLGEHEIYKVCPITIGSRGITMFCSARGKFSTIKKFDLDIEARADGFKDWEDMRDWFSKNHGLPFEGTLIKW